MSRVRVPAFFGILAGLYLFFSPGLPRIGWVNAPSAWYILPFLLAMILLAANPGKPSSPGPEFLRSCARKGPVVATVIAVQFLFHLPFLVHPAARLNSDAAVTSLMVSHIVHSGSRPIYFFGQHYQGSLDAYLYSLFHLLGVSPPTAVVMGNMVLYIALILLAIRVVRRLNGGAWAPVLMVLSLPLSAFYRFAQDRIRCASLILILLLYLMDLSLDALRTGQLRGFRFGVVAGLLFWCYQPALIPVTVLILMLLGGRRLSPAGEPKIPFLAGAAGFLLGVFPHLLAEINNGFINTSVVHSALIGKVWSRLHNVAEAFLLLFRFPATGTVVRWGILGLTVVATVAVLIRARRHRDGLRIMPLALALCSVCILSLTRYPPEFRFSSHYRLLGFFFVLVVAQFLATIPWHRARLPAVLLIMGFGLFLGFRSAGLMERLGREEKRTQKEIQCLRSKASPLVLGGYWDTVRLAPFLPGRTLAPCLNPRVPGSAFSGSKYYPNALNLGAKWERQEVSLLVPGDRAARLGRIFRSFGISFSRLSPVPRPPRVLFVHLEPRPSMRFLIAGLTESFLEDAAGPLNSSLETLRAYAAGLEPPRVQSHSIEVPGGGLCPGGTGCWSVILESEECRVRLPLKAGEQSTQYLLAPAVGIPPGEYRVHFRYLDMPILAKSPLSIARASPITRGGLRFSRLSDCFFVSFFQQRPLKFRVGSPCHGCRIHIMDNEIQALHLEVASLFNFYSTIWTHRFQQVLTVNGVAYPLDPGGNRLYIVPPRDGVLTLNTRYRSLLCARDSRRSLVALPMGVLLQRVVPVYAGRPGSPVSPFLVKR